MLRIFFIISVVPCIFPVLSECLTISDEDYKLLPPIYRMDDYQECVRKENIYCTVDIKLDSSNKTSNTWKLIEETRKDKLFYNHDVIHRAICMSSKYTNKSKDRERFATISINKEMKQFNLTSKVVNVLCAQDLPSAEPTDNLMYIVWSYLTLVVSATLYDFIMRRQSSSVKGNPILLAFSLQSNCEKIFSQNKSKNYQKLKCVEGIRTITAMLTVLVHSVFSHFVNFVEQTNFLEDMPYYCLRFLITIFVFFMQIFILISAWLLAVQVYDIFEANKKFTLKDAVVIFINRCFRFWPTLLIVMAIQKKLFEQLKLTVPFPHLLAACVGSCQNYGWWSLLFVQNNFKLKDMCFGPGWYISNDIQLFAISLVILYIYYKFKFSNHFLGFCLFISCAVFGSTIYLYDLDIIDRFTPERAKWMNFANDSDFNYLYSMAHVNSITYILGICFGIIFYRLRFNKIFNKKILFISMWNYLFVGLPALAVAVASKEYTRVSAVLVGPLVRVMFSLGIGIGILGMSQSTGGFKRVFEWRPLEFLSQFTFCCFMYHSYVVFPRAIVAETPLNVSYPILITTFTKDIVYAFQIASIMHLLVELPCKNLQKIVLPQIKKRTNKIE